MKHVPLYIAGILFFWAGSVSAATYYVSTNGSDSNAGTITAPFRTLVKGVSVLSPGSTLYVRGGTYNEPANQLRMPSGTASSPILVSHYASETVILINYPWSLYGLSQGTSYVTIDGFIFDGTAPYFGNNGGGGYFPPDHVTLKNSEIKNVVGQPLLVAGSHNVFSHLLIHDNGASYYDNGPYVTGSYHTLEYIEIYHNCGTSMQVYQSEGLSVDNNIIRNNYIHDTSGKWMQTGRPACITNSLGNPDVGKGQGILVRGNNNLIYNNVVANIDSSIDPCGYGCGGIVLYDWGNNNRVYNNTVYGISSASGIQINSGVTNSFVKNNISYGNTTNLDNESGSTIVSNNFTSDPLFVSVSGENFHLQSASPAINAGVVLSEFTTDKDDNIRVGNYDAGAYEYGGTVPSTLLGDINNDRIVNSLDWSLMSAKWLTNDTNADLNKDGAVNSLDWSIMSSNWLKTI